MTILNKTLGLFTLIILTGCTKEEYYTQEIENSTYEKVITNYGAIGDGSTDCSGVINKLISEMPASGGVIVIPEGDFVLDKPITIDRNFITIKGINPGMRSNVDVDVNKLLGPGGGSKLILRNAPYGIHIPPMKDVNGRKNRISGVEIKDLLLSGGKSNNGTGIFVEHDNDRCHISNIIGINLNTGIKVIAADAMIIQDSWICEVANSIEMHEGIQNMISNCQLGAQPSGITCKLSNQSNLIFTNNHVYPDGVNNLVLDNCHHVNISGNNFKSFYLGILEIKGNNNLVSNNVFWMLDSENQMMGKGADYGAIRVEGDANLFSSNTIKCEWRTNVVNPVTIRSLSGTRNRYTNLLIENQQSNSVFYVNETTEIFDCVPTEKVKTDGDPSLVYIKY